MFSGFAGSGFFWFLDSTLFSDSLSMSLHGKESGAFGTTSWDLDGKFLSFSWPCFTVVFPVWQVPVFSGFSSLHFLPIHFRCPYMERSRRVLELHRGKGMVNFSFLVTTVVLVFVCDGLSSNPGHAFVHVKQVIEQIEVAHCQDDIDHKTICCLYN